MSRLFLALELPPDIRNALGSLCKGLSKARWTEHDYLHINLIHLSSKTEIADSVLTSVLNEIELPSFHLFLKRLKLVPARGRPEVIHVGIAHHPLLLKLQKEIRGCFDALEVSCELPLIEPHIVLGRVDNCDRNDLEKFVDTHQRYKSRLFPIGEFQLYASRRSASGMSRYSPQATFALQPENLQAETPLAEAKDGPSTKQKGFEYFKRLHQKNQSRDEES